MRRFPRSWGRLPGADAPEPMLNMPGCCGELAPKAAPKLVGTAGAAAPEKLNPPAAGLVSGPPNAKTGFCSAAGVGDLKLKPDEGVAPKAGWVLGTEPKPDVLLVEPKAKEVLFAAGGAAAPKEELKFDVCAAGWPKAKPNDELFAGGDVAPKAGVGWDAGAPKAVVVEEDAEGAPKAEVADFPNGLTLGAEPKPDDCVVDVEPKVFPDAPKPEDPNVGVVVAGADAPNPKELVVVGAEVCPKLKTGPLVAPPEHKNQVK